MELATDICVVCCDEATVTKEVFKYTVGLCDDHKDMTPQDILPIISDDLE